MFTREINRLGEMNVGFRLLSIQDCGLHMHSAYELILVLRGQIGVKCTIFDYTLQEGDVFIVNVKELHAFRQCSEDNLVLVLHLDPYAYLSIFPDLNYYLFVCDTGARQGRGLEAVQSLRRILIDLLFSAISTGAHAKTEAEKRILVLINFLINHFQMFYLDQAGYHGSGGDIDPLELERISKIQEYIFRHYAEKVSLEDLARSLHLSRYYVSHLITNTIGLSMTDFLGLTRIEQSEILLLSTDDSIERIALQCGFSNKRYYEKHFKKWFGILPSEYRENNRGRQADLYDEYDIHSAFSEQVAPLLKPFLSEGGGNGAESPRIASHTVDLSASGHPFRHPWQGRLNISGCAVEMLPTLLHALEAVWKDFPLDTLRISLRSLAGAAGMQPGAGTAGTARAQPEAWAANPFWGYVAREGMRIELAVGPEWHATESGRACLTDFFACCLQIYGAETLGRWTLLLDLPPGGAEAQGLANGFRQALSGIRVEAQAARRAEITYAYDSGLLVPYVIDSALKGRHERLEPFLELCDFDSFSRGTAPPKNTGLLTRFGERKPLYYAWHFLSSLGEALVSLSDGCAVTRQGADFQILVYDHGNLNMSSEPATQMQPASVTLKLTGITQPYAVVRRYQDSGRNLFVQHADMGFPELFSAQEVGLLNQATMPEVRFSTLDPSGGKQFLQVALNPCSSMLIVLKQRELSLSRTTAQSAR
ncbi:MAG: helix-turn-helix domain-containing protein [Clostridiales Family XIII bacterium]|jgi:AraC-like DNA-binding protein|nr:helix-turn-helix domain-containing protein [Clostridiales Family XIII bacterium]